MANRWWQGCQPYTNWKSYRVNGLKWQELAQVVVLHLTKLFFNYYIYKEQFMSVLYFHTTAPYFDQIWHEDLSGQDLNMWKSSKKFGYPQKRFFFIAWEPLVLMYWGCLHSEGLRKQNVTLLHFMFICWRFWYICFSIFGGKKLLFQNPQEGMHLHWNEQLISLHFYYFI
jgi:hypothetical protein